MAGITKTDLLSIIDLYYEESYLYYLYKFFIFFNKRPLTTSSIVWELRKSVKDVTTEILYDKDILKILNFIGSNLTNDNVRNATDLCCWRIQERIKDNEVNYQKTLVRNYQDSLPKIYNEIWHKNQDNVSAIENPYSFHYQQKNSTFSPSTVITAKLPDRFRLV